MKQTYNLTRITKNGEKTRYEPVEIEAHILKYDNSNRGWRWLYHFNIGNEGYTIRTRRNINEEEAVSHLECILKNIVGVELTEFDKFPILMNSEGASSPRKI